MHVQVSVYCRYTEVILPGHRIYAFKIHQILLASNPLSTFIMHMLTTDHKELGITKQEIGVSLILTGGLA